MKFGWINLINAMIILLLMIPNIIYVAKRSTPPSKCAVAVRAAEQIGRYACIAFMIFPVFVWKFGFRSVSEMLAYIAINIILLTAYYAFWIPYFKRETKTVALALAILPTCIFLISGLLLRHVLLVLFAVIFGACHIYITLKEKNYG